MTSNDIKSFLGLYVRSRSHIKVKGHRRGGVCVLGMLLVIFYLIFRVRFLRYEDLVKDDLVAVFKNVFKFLQLPWSKHIEDRIKSKVRAILNSLAIVDPLMGKLC